MAKKVYAPVETLGESLSKEITSIYAPVNSGLESLSKKIVKAYASVGGASKQVFGASSGLIDFFYENYQVGNTYNNHLGNVENSLRKGFQIFLQKNSAYQSSTAYTTIYQNLESIVSRILSEGSGYTYFEININANGISTNWATMSVKYGNDSIPKFEVTVPQSPHDPNGYKYLGVFGDPRFQTTKGMNISVYNSNVTYTPNTNYGECNYIGVEVSNANVTNSYHVRISNIGLRL